MPDTLHRKPVIIIGCNRSGTTLLFRNLSEHPDTWSLYVEAKPIFHEYFPVDPDEGDRVDRAATDDEKQGIRRELFERAHNKEYWKEHPLLRYVPTKLIQRPVNRLYKRPPIRLVEKTPSNCFRIPLVLSLFPDAKFLFIVRRAEAVISSLMEGWKRWSGVEAGEEWTYGKWHYLVPPGWREMRDRPLEEICAFQWISSNRTALSDLREHKDGDFLVLRHEELTSRPIEEYRRVLEFCELEPSRYFQRFIDDLESRVFTTGGSPPRDDKWKELHGEEVERVRESFQPLLEELYGSAET